MVPNKWRNKIKANILILPFCQILSITSVPEPLHTAAILRSIHQSPGHTCATSFRPVLKLHNRSSRFLTDWQHSKWKYLEEYHKYWVDIALSALVMGALSFFRICSVIVFLLNDDCKFRVEDFPHLMGLAKLLPWRTVQLWLNVKLLLKSYPWVTVSEHLKWKRHVLHLLLFIIQRYILQDKDLKRLSPAGISQITPRPHCTAFSIKQPQKKQWFWELKYTTTHRLVKTTEKLQIHFIRHYWDQRKKFTKWNDVNKRCYHSLKIHRSGKDK